MKVLSPHYISFCPFVFRLSMVYSVTHYVLNLGLSKWFLLKSWRESHRQGGLTYSNGHLTVGQTGYYYIYCQLYSREPTAMSYSFFLYIENNPVLKAVQSIKRSGTTYNTNYLGAVFRITAGQSISIRTQYNILLKFTNTEAFFGAFMVHP